MTQGKSKMIRNVGYLFLVNFFNYMLPLLLVPYAISTIGIHGFGQFSIALAIVSYGLILTDFGLNLTATKILCQSKESEINTIVSSVICIKLALYLITTTLLLVGCVLLSSESLGIYLSLSLYLFGFTFSPLWYFQFKEHMKVVTIYNLAPKVLIMPLIFIFVKNEKDLFLYALIWSMSFFVSGVIGLVLLVKEVRVKLPKYSDIVYITTESLPIFYSQVCVKFYSSSNVLVAGFFLGDAAAGVFSAVEKLIRGGVSLLGPIHAVFFPRLNIVLKEDCSKYNKMINQLLIFQTTLTVLIYALVVVLNKWILKVFFGDVSVFSEVNFIIVYLLLIIIPLSNVLGTLVLLPKNKNKDFFKALSSSAIIHIICLPVATYYLGLPGVFNMYVITELLVLIMLVYIIFRKKLLPKCSPFNIFG